MKKYFLSYQNKQIGPLSAEEILADIKNQKLTWGSYIFDDVANDWVLLSQHKEFAAKYETEVMTFLSTPENTYIPHQKEWYVLKGENRYGPYSYYEVIRMLQEKNLYEFDFVWTRFMENWKRISECEDFQPEKIKLLRESNLPEVKEIFFRRRYARVRYQTPVLVHNSKTVWEGASFELSSGGAGLVLPEKAFEPGQTLFLHFKNGEDVPPFNAISSIVSKQLNDSDSWDVKYGVKFTNISRDVRHAIKLFTEKLVAAA